MLRAEARVNARPLVCDGETLANVQFEIDCTPAEARGFPGPPDMRELHFEIVKRFEERLIGNVDALSAQEVIQNWFAFNAGGARQIQNLFAGVLGRGASGLAAREDEDKKP